jgi:hypothetical protein
VRNMGLVGAILALSIGMAACGDSDESGATAVPAYDILRGGEEGHCVLNAEGIKQLVDCGSPHNMEITAMVDYPADMAYPEYVGGLPRRFFDDCNASFLAYVGVTPPGGEPNPELLDSTPVTPMEEWWAEGFHRIACTAESETLWSGTVRGLGGLAPER